MHSNNFVDRESLKDITCFIRSISPASVEKICINLGLQGVEKDVWLLRYRDNISIEEVADRLNISVATVNRVIQKLKIMIAIEVAST